MTWMFLRGEKYPPFNPFSCFPFVDVNVCAFILIVETKTVSLGSIV